MRTADVETGGQSRRPRRPSTRRSLRGRPRPWPFLVDRYGKAREVIIRGAVGGGVRSAQTFYHTPMRARIEVPVEVSADQNVMIAGLSSRYLGRSDTRAADRTVRYASTGERQAPVKHADRLRARYREL